MIAYSCILLLYFTIVFRCLTIYHRREKMKKYAIIGLIALLAVAVTSRIPQARQLVFGA